MFVSILLPIQPLWVIREVELLGKEFDLLVYFLQNQNVILPKSQIFDRLWGFDSDTTVSVVEVYVSKIRKKLKRNGLCCQPPNLKKCGVHFEEC